MKWTLLVLI